MLSKCPRKAPLRKKRLPVVSNDGELDRESVVKEILTTAYVKLFLEEERYLLVMERRNNYYLLITAYEVTEEWSLRSIKREAARKGT